ncbi:MAG: SprT-like domain-containing protein [Brevinema sp.]
MILQQSLQRVNQEYFQFEELPQIVLSRGRQKEHRRAIVFGTYHLKDNKIKIHPVLLEQKEFVLDFVVYHELLHYQDRNELKKRKKGDPVHTKAFRERERQFAQHDEAQKILKDILYNRDTSMDTTEKKTSPENKQIKKPRLRGEALENALAESLKNLDRVLQKYHVEDETKKGAKRGSKKRNDETELADSY